MLKRIGSFLLTGLLFIQPAHAVLPNIFATQPTGNVAASLLDTNFTFLEALGVQGLTTTGSSNTYIATPADAWLTGYSSYTARALTIKPSFGNTGASTINVSGLGNVAIYKNVSGVATALASGDIASGIPAILICDGTGFLLANPTPSAGFSVGNITNSISGVVTITTASTYYDGPSVNQGSTGTWCASGQITVTDSAGVTTISAKLWDGTTVINAATTTVYTLNNYNTVALFGCLASPAGNLRISVTSSRSGTSTIQPNASGLGKDSTITAYRIQ